MRMKSSLSKVVAKMSQATGYNADVVVRCATSINRHCIDFRSDSHPELMESACDAVVAAGSVDVLVKVPDEGPDRAKQ